MGELHLQVVHQRLIGDYKVGASLGKMRVAYRESITEELQNTSKLQHTVKVEQIECPHTAK